jgi:HEAT repeat protein
LRELPASEAIPLLLLGLEQEAFLVRSLSCAGLGVKRGEAGWQALVAALAGDEDANVRAEAANALASFGCARAWPLLQQAFVRDSQWLVRCSILSALAEDPAMPDGTVRVGGAEILGRLVREGAAAASGSNDPAGEARRLLQGLLQDPDHRVVAAALNGLQA